MVAEHNKKSSGSLATKVGATYVFQNSRNSRHFPSSKLFRQLIRILIIVYDEEGEHINILSKNIIYFLPSLLHCVFKHENELQITLAPKIQSRSQRLRSFWSAPRKQDLWANQCQNPANRNLIGYYILPEASLNRRFQNKKRNRLSKISKQKPP